MLVLEGRDRAGGRLNSTSIASIPGAHVDLGAMWIHNAIPGRNELYDLAARLGLAMSPRQVSTAWLGRLCSCCRLPSQQRWYPPPL